MPSGSVSLANLRLSTVTGTQFVDFSAANTLTPYLKWRLILTDSAGKKLTARILTAGSGETWGGELVTNGNMETGTPPSNWIASSATAIASTERTGGTGSQSIQVTRTGASGRVFQYLTTEIGALYKFTVYAKRGTSATYYLTFDAMGLLSYTDADWTLKTIYRTATVTSNSVALFGGNADTLTSLYDDASIRKQLTPSATGVAISIISNEGINVNDSEGYTYRLIPAKRSFSFAFDFEF